MELWQGPHASWHNLSRAVTGSPENESIHRGAFLHFIFVVYGNVETRASESSRIMSTTKSLARPAVQLSHLKSNKFFRARVGMRIEGL